MNISEMLLYGGVILMGVVFIFFRKPGVSLAKSGPIWNAKECYTPLGVKLFYLSASMGIVGIYFIYFRPVGVIG